MIRLLVLIAALFASSYQGTHEPKSVQQTAVAPAPQFHPGDVVEVVNPVSVWFGEIGVVSDSRVSPIYPRGWNGDPSKITYRETTTVVFYLGEPDETLAKFKSTDLILAN